MKSFGGLLFLNAVAILSTVFCLLMIVRISTYKGELQIKAIVFFVTVLVLSVWSAGRSLWRLFRGLASQRRVTEFGEHE